MKAFFIILLLCFSQVGVGARERILHLGSQIPLLTLKVGWVTVIELPLKPTKVVRGSKLVSVQFNGSDILVTPLTVGLTSNLVVYADGTRYTFNLKSIAAGSFDEIVHVRHTTKTNEKHTQKLKIPYTDER